MLIVVLYLHVFVIIQVLFMTSSPYEQTFENFVHTRYIVINHIHNGKHPTNYKINIIYMISNDHTLYLCSLYEHYGEAIKKLEVQSGM